MRSPRGFFSLSAIVSIILVIAVAGAAGWYVTQNHASFNQSENTTSNTSLQTYTNAQYGFSFQYPSNWELNSQSSDAQVVRVKTSGKVYSASFDVSGYTDQTVIAKCNTVPDD